MGEILLYPIIFAAIGWTSRLAKAKGRNPWIWGGAALLLSLLHAPETALLSVIPVVVLLFMKAPTTLPEEQTNRLACARCAKAHSEGQHFCTGCGWDLGEAYSPEISEEGQPFPARPSVQVASTTATVTSAPDSSELNAPAASVVETPETETTAVTSTPADGLEEITPETVAEEPVEQPAEQPEEQPAGEHVPWGTYDPGLAPTAAVMTSRGMERFAEEKYQEAIDQFTKAIALDPNYAEAWEKRAEAFAQMGRSEQAANDRRHLQGLDPSSSPG